MFDAEKKRGSVQLGNTPPGVIPPQIATDGTGIVWGRTNGVPGWDDVDRAIPRKWGIIGCMLGTRPPQVPHWRLPHPWHDKARRHLTAVT